MPGTSNVGLALYGRRTVTTKGISCRVSEWIFKTDVIKPITRRGTIGVQRPIALQVERIDHLGVAGVVVRVAPAGIGLHAAAVENRDIFAAKADQFALLHRIGVNWRLRLMLLDKQAGGLY